MLTILKTLLKLVPSLASTGFNVAVPYVGPAISFLVKHWKLVLLVLAVGGMGIEGWHLARSWDRERALVAQADTLKRRLGTITFLQASDAKRAKDNADAINKLKDASNDTPQNAAACLPRAAVGRVRAIR